MREFATGATKSSEEGKIDYHGFLHPHVLLAFGRYMQKHMVQEDGTRRTSDNWQKGIPQEALIKSLWRHFQDVCLYSYGLDELATESKEDSLCACLFNIQALLLAHLNDVASKASIRSGEKIIKADSLFSWQTSEEAFLNSLPQHLRLSPEEEGL